MKLSFSLVLVSLLAVRFASADTPTRPGNLQAGSTPAKASKPADNPKNTDNSKAAELEALAKTLEAAAANWMTDKPVDPAIEQKLTAFVFDDEAVKALPAVLATRRKDPVDLYVAHRLFQRLLTAEPALIHKAIPTVKSFETKSEYRQFTPVSPAELAKLVYKDNQTPDQMAAVQKARDEKHAREWPIKLHNEMRYQVARDLFFLMAAAQTDADDKSLVQAIGQEEKKNMHSYYEALDAIRSQIPKTTPQRAKSLMEQLKAIASGNNMFKKKRLAYFGAIKVESAANTVIPVADEYIGITILTVANELAKPANMPLLPVPTPTQVEEMLATGKTKTPIVPPAPPK